MSEVYTVSQLQGILTPVFQKNRVRKAVLFGSYSKGQATNHSDVDIMVDSGLLHCVLKNEQTLCQGLNKPLALFDCLFYTENAEKR